MRELARIQLRFAHKPFVEVWNKISGIQIEFGNISLYRDSQEYHKLRDTFQEFYLVEEPDWIEWIEVEYSEEELRNSEMLVLHVNGYAGNGGNALAQVYQELDRCCVCGSVSEIRQVENVVLDLSRSSREGIDPEDPQAFKHDICRTGFDDEIIVTEKVRELMETHRITGLEFRSVVLIGDSVVSSNRYYQLVILDRLGPVVPPTRLVYDKLCPECGRYAKVAIEIPKPYLVSPHSEPYFERQHYGGQDISLSTTKLRGTRSPVGKSMIIASQKLYHLLWDNGVSGFWAQPAHLV